MFALLDGQKQRLKTARPAEGLRFGRLPSDRLRLDVGGEPTRTITATPFAATPSDRRNAWTPRRGRQCYLHMRDAFAWSSDCIGDDQFGFARQR